MPTNPNASPDATPLEKLAASRLALQQSLHPQADDASEAETGDKIKKAAPRKAFFALRGEKAKRPARLEQAAPTGQNAWSRLLQIGSVMGSVAQRRWRNHPARLAADVARPVLMQEARKHPVRLLVLAASAGAAVVLLKPWRWKAPEKYLRSTAAMEMRRIASAGFGVALAQLVGRKI